MSPVVVLVGPPGSGKSTVGALLADRLAVAARDTDTDVEAEVGSTVQELFVTHGEAHFRRIEADAVARALAEHSGVLALGGGSVLDERTRAALQDHQVVFLDVGLSQVSRRVGLGSGRPLLMGNVRATLRTLLQERREHYESVATVVVPTDDLTPEEVVDRIVEDLRLSESEEAR